MHRGAEIEQHHLAGVRLPQIVGEVRIGLHHAELEQLAEHQPLEQRADRIARGLRDAFFGERVERLAFHVVHGQDARRGQVAVRARHDEPRLVGDQRGVALEGGRLRQVVGLLRKLARGLGGDRGNVDFVRQQLQHLQRRGEVVDVASDRARHARVLDLQRQFSAIRRAGAMHLSDRGRRDRLVVELLEPCFPALAVFASEHAAQLRDRHRRRLRAQHGERLRELRRQQVGALQRHHLAQLHRPAAQARQPLREAARVLGGEEGARGFAPATGEPAHTLGRAAEREFSHRQRRARQTPETGLRHARGFYRAHARCALAVQFVGRDTSSRNGVLLRLRLSACRGRSAETRPPKHTFGFTTPSAVVTDSRR